MRPSRAERYAAMRTSRDFRPSRPVAQVRAVFLECEAKHADGCFGYVGAVLDHLLEGGARDVAAHVVVDTASREDDLRDVAHAFGLFGEVGRIEAETVATDQAGTERQEVPLGAGGLEDSLGVDAEASEQDGELVHQRDVQVALGVLDDLGGLGYADALGPVRAGSDDFAVERVHRFGGLGC